ncbi:MAG: hypothetical protein U9R43_10910 [Thermodesulfobacteriota bacterium]|nr:hypothetical protein [Thermodesulfobacteriota bacterium]
MMELINKSKTKQFGILLIIIGAFIPSILYPFSSLSWSADLAKVVFAMKGVSYNTSLQDLEIVLAKGEWKEDNKNASGHYEGRLAIPYRYSLAFGILLAFIGIGVVVFHKNRRETD